MSSIDSLEPYYLAISLCLVVPSIPLSIYVYHRILTSREYSKSRYLQLYTARALNEGISFSTHLLCLHLPIQNFMFPILSQITHSIVLPIIGFILIVSLLASFLYGIFLSLNRYLAIARVSLFRKVCRYVNAMCIDIFLYNNNYVIFAIILIYPLPIFFGLRYAIWPPHFIEFKGKSGPIFLFFTPEMEGFTDIYEYCITSYYLLCCGIEFTINGATLYAIMSKKVFEGSTIKRRVEMGLYITTLCSFSFSLMFAVAQARHYFDTVFNCPLGVHPILPFLDCFDVCNGEQIVVDLMALTNVYFLLAFSPALRRNVFGVSRVMGVDAYNKPTASVQLSPKT